jgi:hypothetical protein
MRKVLILVSVAVLLILAGACTTFQASGLEMHTVATNGDILGNFDVKVTVHRFLGMTAGATLANLFQDSIDSKVNDAIRKEITSRGGTAAVNVRLEHQATGLQVFLNWLTGMLYSPVTLHITGTVIR